MLRTPWHWVAIWNKFIQNYLINVQLEMGLRKLILTLAYPKIFWTLFLFGPFREARFYSFVISYNQYIYHACWLDACNLRLGLIKKGTKSKLSCLMINYKAFAWFYILGCMLSKACNQWVVSRMTCYELMFKIKNNIEIFSFYSFERTCLPLGTVTLCRVMFHAFDDSWFMINLRCHSGT